MSGMQQASVSDNSKFECVYDGTTAAGAAASRGATKGIEQSGGIHAGCPPSQCAGTSNTTKAVPGVGDEALEHADRLFVRKGSIGRTLTQCQRPPNRTPRRSSRGRLSAASDRTYDADVRFRSLPTTSEASPAAG